MVSSGFPEDKQHAEHNLTWSIGVLEYCRKQGTIVVLNPIRRHSILRVLHFFIPITLKTYNIQQCQAAITYLLFGESFQKSLFTCGYQALIFSKLNRG
jgi:hypothetical protein